MCLTSFGCERKRPLRVRRRSGQSAARTDAPPKRQDHDKRGAWELTMKLWCRRMELWCPRKGGWRPHLLYSLCGPQSLNTERTEHLRDLSVEALEAPRSQREFVWLRPTVALSFLRGGRNGALPRSGERRERGPQPTQRRLQQGHRPRVGIAHEEEHEEGSGQVVLDREGVGDVEQEIDGQAQFRRGQPAGAVQVFLALPAVGASFHAI